MAMGQRPWRTRLWSVVAVLALSGLQADAGHSYSKHIPVNPALDAWEFITTWDLPLPYLGNTVTAATIMMNASLVTQYEEREDRDNIVVDILGQGPIPWSISRFNRGDLSPRIQPRHPYAQRNLGVPADGHVGFYASGAMDFSAQAWRPDPLAGVLLASVAQNGQQWNDTSPRFYGTVACVTNSEGFGYSMTTGTFGHDDPNLDVSVGKAGQAGEANIDVAIAWFPYDQGWIAGYLDQPQRDIYSPPQWQFIGSHSSLLPENAGDVVKWGEHGASLKLPGIDPSKDGMLFTTSTDPSKENNNVNTVAIYTKRRAKEWRVQQREDSTDDPTQLVKPTQMMFAFVFVPWTAGGLIGGNIDGLSGRILNGRGPFRMIRRQVGEYELTVGGPHEAEWGNDTKTAQDGMLLLQVIGRDDVNRKYAQHAFLSYNYTDSGSMIIEARHLVKAANGSEDFPLVDCDFSFVWVDFKHPLTPDMSSFSGYFIGSSTALHFWTGFFVAFAIMLAVGGIAVGIFIYIKRRTEQSPFAMFHGEGDVSELGTDLLRSDFKFSE